ncbi:hypothetical protein PGB90_010094 [Kerria lacca]
MVHLHRILFLYFCLIFIGCSIAVKKPRPKRTIFPPKTIEHTFNREPRTYDSSVIKKPREYLSIGHSYGTARDAHRYTIRPHERPKQPSIDFLDEKWDTEYTVKKPRPKRTIFPPKTIEHTFNREPRTYDTSVMKKPRPKQPPSDFLDEKWDTEYTGLRTRRSPIFPLLMHGHPFNREPITHNSLVIKGPLGSLSIGNSYGNPYHEGQELSPGFNTVNKNYENSNAAHPAVLQQGFLGVKLLLGNSQPQNSGLPSNFDSSTDCIHNSGIVTTPKFTITETSTRPTIPYPYSTINPSVIPQTNTNSNNLDNAIEEIFGNPTKEGTNSGNNVRPNTSNNYENVADHGQTGEGLIDLRFLNNSSKSQNISAHN